MGLEKFKTHAIGIKVRGADVDITGAIFHPCYFSYFSDGRLEFMKSHDVDMVGKEIGFHIENKTYPIRFVVVEVLCRIHAPSKIGDLLSLETYISEVKEKTVTFGHQLFTKENGVLLAEGYGAWVCCNISTNKSQKIPSQVKDFFLHIQRS